MCMLQQLPVQNELAVCVSELHENKLSNRKLIFFFNGTSYFFHGIWGNQGNGSAYYGIVENVVMQAFILSDKILPKTEKLLAEKETLQNYLTPAVIKILIL